MTTSARAYGGVPAEQRQAERRDRLIDAALTIIGEDGAAALTVHRVCRTARLNERYYYESFPERDDLLEAVAADCGALVVGALVAAMADAQDDPRAQATAAVAAGVDLLAADPRLGRLMIETAGHPVLARLRAELNGALVALMTERALAALKLEHTAEVERDAGFAATMLLGGLLEVLTRWATGALELTRDELVDRCVEMFLLVGEGQRMAPGE